MAWAASPMTPSARGVSGPLLAAAMLTLALGAFLLAAWAPLTFAIAIVFLFAGPHNWFEARYFLTRLPARWGKLRPFFALGLGGAVVLTVGFAVLPWWASAEGWDWPTALATWNTAIICWIIYLVQLRSHQNPRRAWDWTVVAGWVLIALAWTFPFYCTLALVYLHPLMALWLLDRELRRSRPEWRPAYHACLALLPLALVALWWQSWNAPAPHLERADFRAVANQAGAYLLPGMSIYLVVATHAFLEMVHYGVWLLAMPLIGLKEQPWRLERVPLARRSPTWRRAIALTLLIGLLVVVGLWVCFLADYSVTYQVYFSVAMLHVLVEVPFLLRSL